MKNETKIKILNILIFCGITISTYLFWLKTSMVDTSFCDITQGISCSTVLNSSYSEIFGTPVALLSALYLGFVLIYLHRGSSTKVVQNLLGMASVFGLYLLYIQHFVLHAYCIFCLALDAILISAFAVSLQLKEEKNK